MAEARPKTGRRGDQTIHYSVGAIIKDQGKVLLIDRANPPYGWAGPSGHIDESEVPDQALKREVLEETGLEDVHSELLIEEFVDWNECSKGTKGHYWYVYLVETTGSVTPSPEAKQIVWQPIDKLSDLELEPVWHKWFIALKWL